jgi:SM-20-related protein
VDGRASQPNGQIVYEAFRIGESRRRLFVLDHVLDDSAARLIHEQFLELPMTLSDSDRPDTTHVRHLKHEFEPAEWASGPVFPLLTGTARSFLHEHRIACGAVYRIYANFNLHGDFQFAHEDGEGWTALLFINSRWEEDWGGELIIYPDGNASFAYCITPRPGRMVLFDGMIRHRGGAPSKLCLEARISLAIKFRPAPVRRITRA